MRKEPEASSNVRQQGKRTEDERDRALLPVLAGIGVIVISVAGLIHKYPDGIFGKQPEPPKAKTPVDPERTPQVHGLIEDTELRNGSVQEVAPPNFIPPNFRTVDGVRMEGIPGHLEGEFRPSKNIYP